MFFRVIVIKWSHLARKGNVMHYVQPGTKVCIPLSRAVVCSEQSNLHLASYVCQPCMKVCMLSDRATASRMQLLLIFCRSTHTKVHTVARGGEPDNNLCAREVEAHPATDLWPKRTLKKRRHTGDAHFWKWGPCTALGLWEAKPLLLWHLPLPSVASPVHKLYFKLSVKKFEMWIRAFRGLHKRGGGEMGCLRIRTLKTWCKAGK